MNLLLQNDSSDIANQPWASAVDLFAGCGGSSLGAKFAGVEVKWAANHWQRAVEYHELNHPSAEHKCQDLHQADWSKVPAHDIMLASPACTGHSKARGKERPHHDTMRSTAWAVVSCAEYHRPGLMVVENVEEFMEWALYPSWHDALTRLGYTVSPHIIDAADHGVPQERVRLFLVCTRSKAPLKLALPSRPHVPVNDVLDWNAPNWSLVNKPGRAPNTLLRVASGRARFGDRFVAPFYSSGSGLTGRSIHRPIGTIPTRDRWMVVDGDRMRMLTVDETKAVMGFSADYKLPKASSVAKYMLGNAVCPPVMTDILTAIKQAA